MKKGMLLIFLFSSCTNFMIRQQCDKLNWYQLGYDAALRGDRISNDPQINQCRKAEAEISESQLDVGFKAGMSRYCQPETAYQTGKQGDTLNSDFCESNTLNLIKQKFNEGNKAYCADGMTAGQSGKKYKNVCSALAEKTFTPQYKIGRKKYLTNLVNLAESKKQEINSELNRIDVQQMMTSQRLAILPQAIVGEADPYFGERIQMNNEINSLKNQLSEIRYKNDLLNKQITEYQTELATLD